MLPSLPSLPALGRRAVIGLGAGLALPGAWAAAASTNRPLHLPRLPLVQHRLANGLHVVAMRDPATPTVAVQMWFGVGGRDDPPGRSGFAHLFEHLMFKGTRHMPSEMFDRLTEDVGGYSNAFTVEDVTAYQSLVPANHLERLLWAEGERLASLKLDQATFDSERAVVQEEFRERVLAAPYGRLFNALPGLAFERGAYRRPVIGNIDELNAATLDDVKRFHATWYRSDNATLIVVGDFDPLQLQVWAERYLGTVPRPAQPLPARAATAAPALQPRRVALHGPQVPLPAVALLWRGPPARSPDAPALSVAASLLGEGDSSRLNEALVVGRRSAQSAGFSSALHAQAGMLVALAIAAGGQDAAQLAPQLRREIERLARRPIDPAELAKVRNQLVTQVLSARQRPDGKCEAVGWALALHGQASRADRELDLLQAVTASGVQRALARHVLGRAHLSLHYSQEPKP